MSLYKFIHIPLLKNYGQLKQKSDKQPKKKITQFIKKIKIMSKKGRRRRRQCLAQERKRRKKKNETTCPRQHRKKSGRNWMNCPCASVHGHFCPLSSFIFSLQFSL